MIIVSNEKVEVKRPDVRSQMTYDEFVRKAFGDEGLDVNDTLFFNVSDVEPEVYEELKEIDYVKFFTTDGSIPGFITSDVENWSSLMKSNDTVKRENSDNISSVDVSYVGGGNDNTNSGGASDIAKQMMAFGTLQSLIQASSPAGEPNPKDADVYVFGSSKGGSGKTFTAIYGAYTYAKQHPDKRIAFLDFDITDGQVGISIHRVSPTMKDYYGHYKGGYTDFNTMKKFAVKGNDVYPDNVDFYLAPPASKGRINDDGFWKNIIKNCIENYDVIIFDTGIDYLNIAPISYAYKIADKVLLTTTTSIKSVNSVINQIKILKGETPNPTFTAEDDISHRLNLIITQMVATNEMNNDVFQTLKPHCNIVATFGVLSEYISRAEYYGEWDVFDKKPQIIEAFRRIMKI